MAESGATPLSVFLSYRRDDAADAAGRIYDALERELDNAELFMDIDAIPPGVDFVEYINDAVGRCDVLIAVIGKKWLTLRDNKARARRLDLENDFVRLEIAAALERDVRVIPALVQGARMPQATDLPEPLRPLANRNALDLSHQQFGSSIQKLIDALATMRDEKLGSRAADAVAGDQEETGEAAVGGAHLEPTFEIRYGTAVESVAYSLDGRLFLLLGHDRDAGFGAASVYERYALPVEMPDQGSTYRERLLDFLVERNEALMERYLDGAEISDEEVAHALKDAVMRGEITELNEVARLNSVSAVAFSPDGRYVVGGMDDGTVRIWEATNGREVACMTHGDEPVLDVAFSPDGLHVVSAGGEEEPTACVWDASNRRRIAVLECEHIPDTVAFSPDGRYVATGCGDGTARVWEAAMGREIARVKHDQPPGPSVVFSLDGRYVVSGGWGGDARIWEALSGREVARLEHGKPLRPVLSFPVVVDVSPDGQHVVTGGADGTARIWEATNGREVARVAHEGPVNAVAFSPDGRYVVSGGGDRIARLWEATTARKIARMTHQDEVLAAAFSPDGREVATGSRDRSARMWDLAAVRTAPG